MENIELEATIRCLEEQLPSQTRSELILLSNALHRHAAQDIYAPLNVPPFNRSAMDGYAVKAAQTVGASKDSPIALEVAGVILAGDGADIQGQAVKIMTGAQIPADFDAVVCQEDTDYGSEQVRLYAEAKPYNNYIKIGEEIRQGQLVIKQGCRLLPIHLGILASLGFDQVEVMVPLKVGLLSTGSELTPPGTPLENGHIYESNSFMLAGRLRELGVETVFNRQVGDDFQEACQFIQQSMNQINLLLATGGVSVGQKDIMHDVFKSLGVKRLFWRLKLRPGTPALAGVYEGKLILGLSGNPFAALVTFELLFRSLLSHFLKTDAYLCLRRKAFLMADFPKASRQRRFVRAHFEDGKVYLPAMAHESSVLSGMVLCNCLIDIPAGNKGLKEGDLVEIVRL